jgi:hypothetical protein
MVLSPIAKSEVIQNGEASGLCWLVSEESRSRQTEMSRRTYQLVGTNKFMSYYA